MVSGATVTLELVFAEIHADRDGVTELVPRDDWRAYMKAMVPMVRSVARGPVVRVAGRVRTPTERKTGFEPLTLFIERKWLQRRDLDEATKRFLGHQR